MPQDTQLNVASQSEPSTYVPCATFGGEDWNVEQLEDSVKQLKDDQLKSVKLGPTSKFSRVDIDDPPPSSFKTAKLSDESSFKPPPLREELASAERNRYELWKIASHRSLATSDAHAGRRKSNNRRWSLCRRSPRRGLVLSIKASA